MFDKFYEKHPFLASILFGIVLMTGIGLLTLGPIVLAVLVSVWFLLLYFPLVGTALGIQLYLDEFPDKR